MSDILTFIAFMIVALFIIYGLTKWFLLPIIIEKGLEEIEKAIKELKGDDKE